MKLVMFGSTGASNWIPKGGFPPSLGVQLPGAVD